MKTKHLFLTLLTILFPLAAFADVWQDPETKVNYEYTVGSGKASVSRGNLYKAGSPDVTGDIVILSSFTVDGNSYSVTSIGNYAFDDCSGLTSVTIPNSVTSIANNAFRNCSGLTSVTIPSSVTSIGSYAFEGCSGLTSVTIPNSVTSIDSETFEFCSGLTSIVVESGNTVYDSRNNCNAIIKTDTNELIAGCQNTTIPNSVTSIGVCAFAGCSGLTSITIPNSVTSIEVFAFEFCSGLTSVTISSSVTSIGEEAFYECNGLTSVTIDCVEVGSWFSNKTSIKELHLGEHVTSIGYQAFSGCRGLTSVTIPNSVTSIGHQAFYNCSGLTSVTINSRNLNSIGGHAFDMPCLITLAAVVPPAISSYSFHVASIVRVPDMAVEAYRTADVWKDLAIGIVGQRTKIDYDVHVNRLSNMSALHVAIGEENLPNVYSLKVTGEINGYDIMLMRNKMGHLQYLDLTDANIVANDYEYYTGYHTVDNELGANSFYDMTKLKAVKLPKSITAIGNSAFQNCSNLREVTFQEGLYSIGSSVFSGCTNLKEATLKEGLHTIENNAFRDSGLETLSLPHSLEKIENSAFYNCTSLKTVEFKTGLKSIGGNAFSSSKIEELILPEGLEYIGVDAFSNNSRLKRVAFPSTLRTIGDRAFSGCSSLDSISLPTSLERINSGTFSGCSALTSVHIPSSVTSIANEAFANCSNLNNVYTYIAEPPSIAQNTFSNYSNSTLWVPTTSYYNYWYDTQWSQFRQVNTFDAEYDYLYINNDFIINDQQGTLQGDDIDLDVNPGSGLIVEASQNTQHLAKLHIKMDATRSGSVITAANLVANKTWFDIEVVANRWYFLSFPFNVKRSNIVAPGNYVFRRYDGTQRANGQSGWKDETGNLVAGRGYIFQTNTTGTLSLGVEKADMNWKADNRPQNLVSYPAQDATNASWNLMGNPHTSYYDIDGTGYTQPITVWNGSGYDAVRSGDDDYSLKPFQAFFVQKPEGVSAISFPAQGRATYLQTQQAAKARRAKRLEKGADTSRQLVNLTLSDGETTDKTRIVFNAQKSVDYELDCDAAKFLSTESVPQLYSMDSKRQTQYAINERPLGEVHLGYVAVGKGELTIAATRMDQPVLLRDNDLGLTHDLSAGSYTFSTDAGTFDGRFTIVIDKTTTGISDASRQNNNVEVNGKTGEVYDLQGREVSNGQLKKGSYIVKDGPKAKKVIKH